MSLDKRLQDLKDRYEHIEIPDNLDKVIDEAIRKGKKDMKKAERKSNGWLKGIGTAAAIFVFLTISVNTIPAVGNSLSNVPGVGKLVQVLQFDRGSSSGGNITDGTDVNVITLQKSTDEEKLTINFADADNEMAPYYDIDYSEYPCSMTFSISGARQLSAEEDFAALRESDLISDVYKLITMDDSMVRFSIYFNNPVEYEVEEYKEPAQLVLSLHENENAETEKTVYAIRTASCPWGESLGMIEEQLFQLEDKRVLKDCDGNFLVEAGYYETEAEAQDKMEELKQSLGNDLEFYIEARNINDIPEGISE